MESKCEKKEELPAAYCVVFTRDENGFNFEILGVSDQGDLRQAMADDLERAAQELTPLDSLRGR